MSPHRPSNKREGSRHQVITGSLALVIMGTLACGGPPTANSLVDVGVQWSSPELVVTLTEDDQHTRPVVALDGRDEALVGWLQRSTGGGEHVSVVRHEGARWGPPVNLGPSGLNPQLAMSRSGIAVLVWPGIDPILGGCVMAAASSGPVWTVSAVDCNRTTFAYPELAMSDSGATVVAWEAQPVGVARGVRASRWSEQHHWEVPAELDRDQSGPHPAVAVAANGRALVVWAAGPPALMPTGLRIASASSAGAWGAPQAVPGAGRNVFQRVAIDSAGTPFVAWSGEDGVWHTRLGASGWSAPVRHGNSPCCCLELAAGRPGEAVLSWREAGHVQAWTTAETEAAFVSWAVLGTPDGRWTESRRLGGPADRVGAASAALRDGSGILTWVEMTGTVVTIRAQRLSFAG